MSRRSDYIFSPAATAIQDSFKSLYASIERTVTATVRQGLEDVKAKVEQEHPELANNIYVVEKNGKVAYVMYGDQASDVEYGSQRIAPRAHLRKAAESTSKNLAQNISKLVPQ